MPGSWPGPDSAPRCVASLATSPPTARLFLPPGAGRQSAPAATTATGREEAGGVGPHPGGGRAGQRSRGLRPRAGRARRPARRGGGAGPPGGPAGPAAARLGAGGAVGRDDCRAGRAPSTVPGLPGCPGDGPPERLDRSFQQLADDRSVSPAFLQALHQALGFAPPELGARAGEDDVTMLDIAELFRGAGVADEATLRLLGGVRRQLAPDRQGRGRVLRDQHRAAPPGDRPR